MYDKYMLVVGLLGLQEHECGLLANVSRHEVSDNCHSAIVRYGTWPLGPVPFGHSFFASSLALT